MTHHASKAQRSAANAQDIMDKAMETLNPTVTLVLSLDQAKYLRHIVRLHHYGESVVRSDSDYSRWSDCSISFRFALLDSVLDKLKNALNSYGK